MPFDAGGTFTRSYSWQSDRDAGIKILAQRMDGEFNNYAGGLNQTFLRTGIVPMGGPLNMNSNPIVGIKGGTLQNPGIRFESDTDTGIMQSGPGNLTFVVDGVEMITTTSGAVSIGGNVSFGGGISIAGATTFADGSGVAPGVAFSANAATGMWRNTADGSLNLSVGGGGNRVNITTTGVTIADNMSTGNVNATGQVSSPVIRVNDAFYYMNMAAGNPMLAFDEADYISYDRVANTHNFVVTGGNRFQVNATGAWTLGTHRIGDTNFYMNLDVVGPAITFDPNDFILFTRASNVFSLTIGGGGSRFDVSPTNTNINTPLTVNGQMAVTNILNVKTVTGGGVGFVPGDVNQTGYVSFYKTDSTRVGYIGFASQAGGPIAYVHDLGLGHAFNGGNVSMSNGLTVANGLNVSAGGITVTGGINITGGATFSGTVTATRFNVDGTYGMYLSTGSPILSFDANDFIHYDRAGDSLNVNVGGNGKFSVAAYGASVYGAIRVGDANNYLVLDTTGPIWSWDALDYMSYDRAGNALNVLIGGNGKFAVHSGGINVYGIVSSSGINNSGILSNYGVVRVQSPSAGAGYLELNHGGSGANTGYVAFHRGSDGVRQGYVGFAASPNGTIAYTNDMGGGHNFAGGNVTVGGGSNLLATGDVQLTTNGKSLTFTDASGTHPVMTVQGDNNFVFYGTNAAGAAIPVFGVPMRNNTPVFGVSSNMTVNGTVNAVGKVTAPNFTIDPLFYLTFLNVNKPAIVFDSADYFEYDRGANELQMYIGSNIKTSVHTGGFNVYGNFYASDSVRAAYIRPHASDGAFYLSFSGADPVINFDANDYIRFDRAANVMYIVVNGVIKGQWGP